MPSHGDEALLLPPSPAKESESPPLNERDFFVVGIGASAGGLRALEDFFAHMPQDSGGAFVVIQHLSPDYKSLMKELLGRCTHMAIHRVEDGAVLAPNSVYLIPPGQNLVVSDGRLHLIKQDRLNRQPNFPIDLFFESLAKDRPNQTIAIILSGTGSDGSIGLQAVYQAGGTVLVQDPATAEFDGMPQSALATGMVHRSLSCPELAQLVYHLLHNSTAAPNLNTFVRVRGNHLQQILRLLATHEGIDFSQYKVNTLNRRIQRRCLLAGYQDLDSYLDALETSSEERHILRGDLLISVTQFFRDPPAWQFLETKILPPLVDNMSAENPLRIWVTACATGQEAYSMAILVHELATARGKSIHAKIFATDIDRQCLEKAAQGVYPPSIEEEMSASRLETYFHRKNGGYEIVRTIRDTIVFAPHNLVNDAGFNRMHLVSCRNVLIYMEPALQQQVLRNLHFALEVNGILFLGESETLADLEEEFTTLDRRLKIFAKHRNARLIPPLSTRFQSTPLPLSIASELVKQKPSSSFPQYDKRLQAAFNLLMDKQQGCCLIVDNNGHVQHAFGATPDILPPPNGAVSSEVTKMVAPPLQLPLSTALNHVRKSSEGIVHYSAVALSSETDSPKFSLQVVFHSGTRMLDEFAVVLIQPEAGSISLSEQLNPSDFEGSTAQHVFDLESELQRTRESLQATIEELETTNEEQQATNEELIAANEELQSTNEELQSLNEELHTVNAEYQSKIQELTDLNNDVNNLLSSTNIGVIFLDRNLKVRKFTPPVTEIFSLIDGDLGRSITDITHTLDISDFPHQLTSVLENDVPIELEIKIVDAERYMLVGINPYSLEDKRLEGLVVTFVDITPIQQAQKALSDNNILLNTVINSTPDPIFMKDLEGRYQLVNEATAAVIGKSVDAIVGTSDFDHFSEEIARNVAEQDREILASERTCTFEEVVPSVDSEPGEYLTTKTIFRDERGQPIGLVGFARDVSSLKQTQRNLECVNQELQEEIEQRQTALTRLQESEIRFRMTFEEANAGIAHVAFDGTYLRLNQRYTNILGYTPAELVDTKFQDITHPADVEKDFEQLQRLLAGDISGYEMDKRFFHKDRSIVWVNLKVSLVRTEGGDPLYMVSIIQDITQKVQLEAENKRILQELVREKELAQVTLYSIGEAVITTNAVGEVQYCNPIAERITGWSTQEAKGLPIQEVVTLLDDTTREPIPYPFGSPQEETEFACTSESFILVSRDGSESAVSKSVAPMRDRQDNFLGMVAVFRDITESYHLSRQLSWQASHDSLTELRNRRQFEQELSRAVASIRMDDRQEHILCYMDLDRFKLVNDTVGHLAGDELLKQVAALLKSHVRSSDCLARLGGDEFGLLLQNCSLSRAKVLVEGLREAVQDFRFVWDKHTFSIGMSIGMVAINASAKDLPKVLSAADAACYAAKQRGRNRLYVYQPGDDDVSRQRSELQWSSRIQKALDSDLFCLYKQRIVSSQQLDSCAGVGYEVLLRMRDEKGQLVPPNAFIPTAERYNLMPHIDRWVVTTFLRHIESNPEDSSYEIYMLNLSGASLTDEKFLDFLRSVMLSQPKLAEKICFEITETAAVSNLTEAVKFISELRKLGCKFALDDFGSGMSSFGYLKALPADYIKIDGRFIQDIDIDPTARAIVESIHNIGHVLGLKTIAEFVESESAQISVREIGVDYLQGYFIDNPQPL